MEFGTGEQEAVFADDLHLKALLQLPRQRDESEIDRAFAQMLQQRDGLLLAQIKLQIREGPRVPPA